MAFSEAQLNTAIDPAATGRVVTLVTFNPGTVNTDCYCVGVTAPYAGRSRWVQKDERVLPPRKKLRILAWRATPAPVPASYNSRGSTSSAQRTVRSPSA